VSTLNVASSQASLSLLLLLLHFLIAGEISAAAAFIVLQSINQSQNFV